jgi:hypothetical protein
MLALRHRPALRQAGTIGSDEPVTVYVEPGIYPMTAGIACLEAKRARHVELADAKRTQC